MTSQYWQRVWQICEEARQVPHAEQTAFVLANTPDTDLAREVLSLLAAPENSVLPSWGSDGETGGTAAARSARGLTGMRIGRYEVADRIGSGASGDVYSARDVELERSVALKFLRCGKPHSAWKVEGFLREARAASALNHPGIITVHEVIQSESGLGIVMELVEGKALRAFTRSPNSVDFVLRCGIQVASALAAAHSSNIIHRDIKPENIMIRPDGLAKVLDFGLAQSRGSLEGPVLSELRAGTLRYMSPEQAAGEPLTPATDLFSFGLVLYELVAGRHPFPADGSESMLQVLSACRPDPPSRWRRDIPKPLEALILEMLIKAPELRPKAGEVARRLDGLAHPAGWPRRRLWTAVALAPLASAAVAAVWIIRQGPADSAPAPLVPVPLTATAGFDSWPDISPDGKTVVYGWGASPDSYTHIYLQDLEQDAPLKLVEAEPGTRIGHAKWSSDGRRIYYKKTSPRPGSESIWSVARDGTDPRLAVPLTSAELSSGIDCTADGKRIVYSDRARPGRLFAIHTLDLASGQKSVLTAPEDGWGDWDPHYSPDNRQIAFKRVKKAGDDRLYIMPAGGGSARQLELPSQSIYGHAWLPDSGLLISAQLGSVIHGLWTVYDKAGRKPTPLFESGLDATMPSVSRDRIVWVNRVNDYNIYSVPLAGGKPVKRIASPLLDSMPAFAPDGRLAFVSRRSGSPELWIAGGDGANAVRITNLRGSPGRPSWSSDGTRIAFASQRFGISTVFTIRCASGTLRCNAPERLVDGDNPTWSRDGKFVYFKPPDRDEIWKLPSSGGQPVRVAPGLEAFASRDGQWLYFSSVTNGRFSRIRLAEDGSTTGNQELVMGRGTNSAGWQHWAVAGDEILFWENNINSKFSGLRAYHTLTHQFRTIVESPAAEFPAVSPDGKTVWYAQPDAAGGTLMVAERPSRR